MDARGSCVVAGPLLSGKKVLGWEGRAATVMAGRLEVRRSGGRGGPGTLLTFFTPLGTIFSTGTLFYLTSPLSLPICSLNTRKD